MKHLLALMLVAVFATSSFAQDTDAPAKKKSKLPWQVTKIRKMLKPVTLTAEQKTSFDEALQAYAAKISELKGKGLTKDKLKARAVKRKEARQSGIKGKELQTFLNEGMSEEEMNMFKALEQAATMADKTVAQILTEEQLVALPEKVQERMANLKKRHKDGKGKGMKEAAKDE